MRSFAKEHDRNVTDELASMVVKLNRMRVEQDAEIERLKTEIEQLKISKRYNLYRGD